MRAVYISCENYIYFLNLLIKNVVYHKKNKLIINLVLGTNIIKNKY